MGEDQGTVFNNQTYYTVEEIQKGYFCEEMGMVLPFFSEFTWARWFRGTIYLFALLWCFMGVSILADVFMCAIEKITSKTRIITIASATAKGTEEIEIRVWNDTVANLTLMALGSSAPEILLSIIEIVGNNFNAGDLGPSTIVGSAAFNLLVITAVCILAIDSSEVRVIKSVKVFFITSFSCVFAYIWLIIVLVGITADYIDIWEAVLTLLFFPILVLIAYIADKDFCAKTKKTTASMELGFGEFYFSQYAFSSPYCVYLGLFPNELSVQGITRLFHTIVHMNTNHCYSKKSNRHPFSNR